MVALIDFKAEITQINKIYQIKINVPFPVKYVCLYLFKLKDKWILIDAGLNFGKWKESLFSALEKIGISIEQIDYCIITHIHIDHIGLVKTIKTENPKIRIIMSKITNEIFRWETNKENLKELEIEAKNFAKLMVKYGMSEEQGERIVQFFTFWPRYLQYQEPDITVEDGNILLDSLKIIWTPGHSFGHICIFNQTNNILFSGDHILSRITPHIGNFIIPKTLQEKYKKMDFNNILKHYLNSLDRIEKLNPKIILPAHQEIILDVHNRISQIKKHHDNRLKEIMGVIKNNPLTPYEISKIHFGANLDEINSYMALSEVLGHLNYLIMINKVKKFEKSGKIYFIS